MYKLLNRKEGQVWYTDLIVGLTLFLITVVIAFRFISFEQTEKDDTAVLFSEANGFSEQLLSQGIPTNWTRYRVNTIGITSGNNVLNFTKLQKFYNLSQDNYSEVLSVQGLHSDYVIYFENVNQEKLNLTGEIYFGKGNYSNATSAEDLVSVSRYLVYRHDDMAELIKMNILLFRE